MAFYTAVAADRFVSSGYTRGPWDAAAQHAGPPAALLGRAVEAAARPGMRVTRMTFDIARPVPIAPLTVTTRVLVAADSGNGVSNVLDFDRYLFVNADLTVHLLRYPAGEWVCLEAATSIDRAGIGLADTALHDEQGRIGRCAQSQFVARR